MRCGRAGQSARGQQSDQPIPVGEVQRKYFVAEGPLCRLQRGGVVGARMVEFVDGHRAGHLSFVALSPQRPGGLVDRRVGGDHEQRAVGGPESGTQFSDEVGVARGVDEVDLVAAVRNRRHCDPHRPLLPHGRVGVVAHRGAVDHRPGPGQHAGGHQEAFHQRGLARAGGSDQDDVTDGSCGQRLGGLLGHHTELPRNRARHTGNVGPGEIQPATTDFAQR